MPDRIARDTNMPRIYVIHENDAWVEPLREAFREFGLPFSEWFIDRRTAAIAMLRWRSISRTRRYR